MRFRAFRNVEQTQLKTASSTQRNARTACPDPISDPTRCGSITMAASTVMRDQPRLMDLIHPASSSRLKTPGQHGPISYQVVQGICRPLKSQDSAASRGSAGALRRFCRLWWGRSPERPVSHGACRGCVELQLSLDGQGRRRIGRASREDDVTDFQCLEFESVIVVSANVAVTSTPAFPMCRDMLFWLAGFVLHRCRPRWRTPTIVARVHPPAVR